MTLRTVPLVLLVLVLALATTLFGAVEDRVFNAAAAALCLVGLAALVPAALGRMRLPRDPVLLGFVLLVLAALASTLWSANRFLTLRWSVLLVAFTLAYALAAHLPTGRAHTRAVLLALLAVAVAAALYGIWVTLSGREVVLWARKTSYRDSLTGTFINRNHFAAFCNLHLYAAFGWLAASRSRLRLALLLPTALLALALSLTLSRGGLLAAAAAAPLFLALLPGSGRRRLGIVVLALALALGALWLTNWTRLEARLEDALGADGEPSAAARLSLWRSTLAATSDRPLLGWGAGTFASIYPRYREQGLARKVPYAHQEYLELLAEQGILGLLVLAAFAVLAVRALGRTLGRAGSDRPLVAGIAAGLFALAVHAALDFPLKIPAVSLTASALLGLALALGRGERPPELDSSRSRALAVLAALALVSAGARATQGAASSRALRRAEALFERPDWDGAGREFERAIAIDPLDPAGWNGLARTEMNRGKFRGRGDRAAKDALFEAALGHFAAAESRDPRAAEYNLSRAWLLGFLGRDDEATREFELAVADNPFHANVLYHAASFHLHRGRTERGLELMARAIGAWFQVFGAKIPELHQAVGDPDRLLSIIPAEHPFLAYQYAVFLLERGAVEASRRALERALAAPDWQEGWVVYYAGGLARRAGLGPALELYATLPEARRTPAIEREVAKMLVMDGRHAEAVRALERALERFPADAGLLHAMVVYAGDSAASAAAMERTRRALGAGAANDPGLAVAEGETALGRGLPGLALGHFERALVRLPASDPARHGMRRAYAELAARAEAAGDCEVAAELAAAAALASE